MDSEIHSRAFLGISLRGQLDEYFDQLKQLVSENRRWVYPQDLHVTLKYLGDLSEQQIPPLVKTLEMAASLTAATTATVGKLGTFSHRNSVSVLWLGVDDASDHFEPLVAYLENSLQPLGFPKESRKFLPHITIARGGMDPGAIPLPEISLRLDSLAIFATSKSPAPARYEILGSFPLKV